MTLTEVTIIIERDLSIDRHKRCGFTVELPGVEIKDGGLLQGIRGIGTDMLSAKRDCAGQIAGKRLVVDAMKSSRREYTMPPEITVKED